MRCHQNYLFTVKSNLKLITNELTYIAYFITTYKCAFVKTRKKQVPKTLQVVKMWKYVSFTGEPKDFSDDIWTMEPYKSNSRICGLMPKLMS